MKQDEKRDMNGAGRPEQSGGADAFKDALEEGAVNAPEPAAGQKGQAAQAAAEPTTVKRANNSEDSSQAEEQRQTAATKTPQNIRSRSADKGRAVKRGIVARTLAGFFAVWLAFAGAVSWVLVRQEDSRAEHEMRLRISQSLATGHQSGTPEKSKLTKQLDYLLRADSRFKGGAVFRHVKGFELLAEPSLPCQLFSRMSMDHPTLMFSLLDCLDDGQTETLSRLVNAGAEAYMQERERFEKEGHPADERFQGETVDLFASGWARGDEFLPSRIFAARWVRDDSYSLGLPSDLSKMEVLADYEIDTKAVYGLTQEQLDRLTAVENTMVSNHFFRCLDGNPVRIQDFRDALAVIYSAQGEALRSEGRLQCTMLPDITVLFFRDGLSNGQRLAYTQAGDVEYVLLAEVHAVRGSLPVLAGVWAASLLFVLAAGGLVCRAMCQTYDRQAALERSRRDTTNALAHDLKTPLALIRGYAENLQLGIKPEKHAHYLAQIPKEADRMDALLRGMLELSRLESGALPVHREPTELRAFAEECAARWREAAEMQHIRLVTTGGGMLDADRELLGRALDNLLANAVRHTPEGGAVTVTVSDGGLSVENTGEPVPENELAQLFVPYYTRDRARSGSKRQGLGLALVKATAELHGMQVRAENTASGVKISMHL